MKAHGRGILLLFTAFTVAAFTSVMTLYGQNQAIDKPKLPDPQRQRNELESRLPTVDFESPEPSDPEKRERRRKKNARHDNTHLVRKDDSYGSAVSSTVFSEWDLGLPPLPVAKSDVILTAEVSDAQAHLSNDKTGIYSEFTVTVEEVFKTGSSASMSAGSRVILERTGGAVRYPNGRRYSYDVAGQNMPRVGLRYVFFLKCVGEDEAFEIITAYELRGEKVFPLDIADQFNAYKGMEQVTFFTQLKNAIAGK